MKVFGVLRDRKKTYVNPDRQMHRFADLKLIWILWDLLIFEAWMFTDLYVAIFVISENSGIKFQWKYSSFRVSDLASRRVRELTSCRVLILSCLTNYNLGAASDTPQSSI